MKYAAAFASIAISLAMLAVVHGGGFWLLVWPAISFGWVSATYAFKSPRWLGKRPTGRIAIGFVVILLPYFLYTWGMWYLLRLFSREPVANEVVPGLWIGRRAFASELPCKIDVVADLTCEFIEPGDVVSGREYRQLPMLDAGVTGTRDFATFVTELAPFDGAIYVHCAQGHGRSATVIAAILIQRGVCNSMGEAESLLKRARPRVRLNSSQKKLLRAWISGYNEQR